MLSPNKQFTSGVKTKQTISKAINSSSVQKLPGREKGIALIESIDQGKRSLAPAISKARKKMSI